MNAWLRRVTPDLFFAAIIALLLTVALHQIEAYENRRIRKEARVAASDGLTLDERIDVVGDSIRRSTRIYIPVLVAIGGALAGLVCRLKRWVWVTALLAIVPALLTGASFYIDLPIRVGVLITGYVMIAVVMANIFLALRTRLTPIPISRDG